jgi:alpha-D-xyloside xylohydrolase
MTSSLSHRSPDHVQALPGGTLQIVALGDHAFRVRFEPEPSMGVPPSTILASEPAPSALERTERNGVVILRIASARCEIDPEGRITFFDGNDRLLLAEAFNGRRLTRSQLGDELVYAVEQIFDSPADERLFGTGCFQDGALDIRGLPRRLTQVNSQISLPFLLSSRGYGLLWHNRGMSELNRPDRFAPLVRRSTGCAQLENVTTTSGNAEVVRRLATFSCRIEARATGRYAFMLDIGRKMGSRYRVDIDGRTCVDFTNLWLPPTMSFFADLSVGTHEVVVEANDTDKPGLYYAPVRDTTVWRSPVADAIDYVVMAGQDADGVMGVYRELLGTTPMLPIWAYGYVHCRERFHSSEEIIETLDEFRRRSLPIDVVVQDWQYWGKYGWNAMRFDEEHYPDPGMLVEELHRRNARFMLSVWSRVARETELGQEAERRGYYIPNTDWIDFYNPEAVKFYCDEQNKRLGVFGIDAWWQDATEPENDDLAGRATAAGPGEIVRLTYPLQVSKAVYQSRREAEPDQRPAILTRCAFLGQHKYGAVTWSGDIGNDWETLRRQIPAGLNMAAAGYSYWTVDAGGFFRPGPGQYDDPSYRERFLRWFQYATFLPMQRVHGYQTDTEFWRYGEQVETVSRQYLELRYRMLPYIYSSASETTRTGAPMMRPLVFDFADDGRALEEAHSYMFGRAIHVAPVTEPGVDIWPVYLPRTRGGWFDLWTGEHREGGQRHEVSAPLDRIPLHVRAGSILPFGPILQSTVEATNEELSIVVFPGADGTFALYEDQGLDNGYEDGDYAVTPFRWNDSRRELEIGERQGAFAMRAVNKRVVLHAVTPGVMRLGEAAGMTIEYTGEQMITPLTDLLPSAPGDGRRRNEQ